MAWAMNANYWDCREKVRKRRRAAKMADGQRAAAASRAVRLSIRETAEGATVTLSGRQFSISKAVMKRVVTTIERAAPEKLPDVSNNNDAGETHE